MPDRPGVQFLPDGSIDYVKTYKAVHAINVGCTNNNWGIYYWSSWKHYLPGEDHYYEPILEVGCGNGRLCQKLARRGHKNPCGIDVVAADYDRDGYEFITYDITKIPWPSPDNAYPLALAFDVFEHLPLGDLRPVVNEFLRVSERQVISVPHFQSEPDLHRVVESKEWWQKYLGCEWEVLCNSRRNATVFGRKGSPNG